MVEPKTEYRLGSVDWLREMVPWLNFGYLVGLSLLLTERFVTAVESITNCPGLFIVSIPMPAFWAVQR